MPHVARYFSQRAYDTAFEPCLKKSKPDHARTGANNDFLNGADYVSLSGESKHESNKSSHARPGAYNDFLNGTDYVSLSGASKNYSCITPSVKNPGHDFSQRTYDSAFEPCLKNSNPDHSASWGKKSVDLQEPELQSTLFCPDDFFDQKNESNKSSHARPGTNDDFQNGSDYVSLSGASKHYSCKAPVNKTGHDFSQRTYDSTFEACLKNSHPDHSASWDKKSVDLQEPEFQSTLFCPDDFFDHKNESNKSSHAGPGANDDFLNGADYVSLSGASKHYSCDAPSVKQTGHDFSQRTYDSNFEPCLKNSKPDHSALWGNTSVDQQEPELQSNLLSSVVFSDHKNESNKSSYSKPGANDDFLNGSDYVSLSGESKHYSCDAPSVKKTGRDINQQNSTLPKTDKPRCDNDSEVAFSETSTAFIGPLCRPPPKVELEFKNAHNTENDPSSCKIKTVELGNSARKLKSKDGMDYELQQFYKELCELEAATDDQNVSQTTAEHQQEPQCSNAPAAHPNKSPIQIPDPQPCNYFPDNSPSFMPLNSHLSETLVSAANHPTLSPSNHLICSRLESFKETTPPFVSEALSLPRFQDPPHSSFGLYGPPPPRYDYPLSFPQENNMLHTLFPENDNYYMINDDHYSPRTQDPCHISPASSESRFSPQGYSCTKPFLEPPSKSFQQEHHLDGWRERDFGEFSFPEAANGPHEEYEHRFGDNSPSTHSARKLVLLRGLPGSGKTTLARTLLIESPKGIIFSTDDYFYQDNRYTYDVKLLGNAHTWNKDRAKRAMEDGRSPIIIDNTNMQAWEMKPYVQMAIDHDFDVEFLEPNTWWKLDINELEKRNTHRVPAETISKMRDRFEPDMTVGVVMKSVEPRRLRPNRPPPKARPRWEDSADCSQHSMSFHSR